MWCHFEFVDLLWRGVLAVCQVPIAILPPWQGAGKGRMLLDSDAHMTMVGSVDCMMVLSYEYLCSTQLS